MPEVFVGDIEESRVGRPADIVDQNVDATEADIVGTIAGIEAAGGKGLALVADAMSRPDSERVVSTAMERLGRIDILVNNVGGSTYARFLDITD
ncbi:SDR family NAD(P)-dependent oxidoreductase, partial [Mycobacterium sp. 1245801.1]|uniref:SDR family NAD(P)-dependent oxidoreductase n=1 Tax=Mycobacterium sp. 1245801.1 TaxID=1834075 RepID=UPI000AFF168D